jgi:ribosomal protein S21
MRKNRSVETPEERHARKDANADQRRQNEAAADSAIDLMVKQSLEVHGP